MQKVVFIASLHRSGSTVLELTLQNNASLIGLGEVGAFMNRLDQVDDKYCDCGKKVKACEFWGPAFKHLENIQANNYSEMYKVLFESFQERFGENKIPVDSSKTVQALQALQSVSNLEVKVIFLVRDVRAWVTSHKKNSSGHKNFGSARYFLRWYKGNRRIQKHLDQTNADYLQLGYEEIILYPNLSLQRIADFLGVGSFGSNIGLENSSGHSIGGNRMRNDPKKRSHLYYDNRWFYNHQYWLWQMLFFPKIMKYNRQTVYGNIKHPFQS